MLASQGPIGGESNHSAERLSRSLRILNLLAAVAVLAMLFTARWLQPNARGLGTHQQLGLPPCTFVALYGFPCPSCGMTTSWSLFTRGQWTDAARANLGGLMLALIALAYLPASCYFFFSGRASRGGWFSLALAIGLILAMLIAVVQWVVRLTA